MKAFYQLGAGIFMALASSLLVVGALSLASVEGLTLVTPTLEPTQTSLAPVEPGVDTPTPLPSPTPLPPTACPPPKGWQPYTIQNGDTLDSVSQAAGLPASEISKANCLLSPGLFPGAILYLPPQPTSTFTSAPKATEEPSQTQAPPTLQPCGPPPGWSTYIVQPSDNLYRISLAFGTTVSQLQFANCLTNPNSIKAGMKLYVPNVATRTSAPSATRTRIPPTSIPPTSVPPSFTPSLTNTPVPPTLTPTQTVTLTPVPPTFTPTLTSSATETATAVPPSLTPTNTSAVTP